MNLPYDLWLLALCIWREARNCDQSAMEGIAAVIRNRAADARKRWPRTLHEVILQHLQFSSFNAGDPNAVLFPKESNAADWEAWQKAVAAAQPSGALDPTKGANAYESCAADKLPSWAQPSKLTAQLGPFRFYRL